MHFQYELTLKIYGNSITRHELSVDWCKLLQISNTSIIWIIQFYLINLIFYDLDMNSHYEKQISIWYNIQSPVLYFKSAFYQSFAYWQSL